MMEKLQFTFKFMGPFKGELGDKLAGEEKTIWIYGPFSVMS